MFRARARGDGGPAARRRASETRRVHRDAAQPAAALYQVSHLHYRPTFTQGQGFVFRRLSSLHKLLSSKVFGHFGT